MGKYLKGANDNFSGHRDLPLISAHFGLSTIPVMVFVTQSTPDTDLTLFLVRSLFLVRQFMTLTIVSQTTLSTTRLYVALVILALSFALPLFVRRKIVDKDGHPIPPGPFLRYICLRRYPERTLSAWAKTYGPLFSVWMGNQLVVVISDARIAKDLLVSNGAIFSSRKQYFMKSQTILRGRAITSSPYNDTWSVVVNDSHETGN